MAKKKKTRSVESVEVAQSEFEQSGLNKKIRRSQEFAAPYRIDKGKKFRLEDVDPADTAGLNAEDKPRAKEILAMGRDVLSQLQERLYAQDR